MKEMEEVVHSFIQRVFIEVGVKGVLVGALIAMINYNKATEEVGVIEVRNDTWKTLIISSPVKGKER
jgi:hypothetical protein